MVVVLSGSMEPAFQRGDILWLTNYDDPIRTGEIVVFKIKGRDIPIVHRVLQIHEEYVAFDDVWNIYSIGLAVLKVYRNF